MIEADMRKAIYLLHQTGMGDQEISFRMKCSMNTVKEIIKQQGHMPHTIRKDKILVDEQLLRRLYTECDGFAQRVKERLFEEEGIGVAYSTLTRLLRDLEISTQKKERCGQVPDQPGEMQHDTSLYHIKLGEIMVKLIASLLYLRFSKKRYLKFYRSFNRFTMKCFFHEALMCWGYAAKDCIIDNTNLARLRGVGKNAVIVPEMKDFAKRYGFAFFCHELGHANRKAGEERGFRTITTNFLPGRTFSTLEDLNSQALEWATVRMEHRPQGDGKVIPAKAFEVEKEVLVKLLPQLPAPYCDHQRGTDQYGYVAFQGNYYWVPGTRRDDVIILEYSDHLRIHKARECLATYALPKDGVKNERFTPEGFPPPRHQPKSRKKPTEHEEERLRKMAESVGAYVDFSCRNLGASRHRFLRRLFALSKKMTEDLFIKSIERALTYKIKSIETIERIAFLLMNQPDEMLPSVEIDEGFREREGYLEGYLTDAPDLSKYQTALEDDDVDDDTEHE
jgi:transposase